MPNEKIEDLGCLPNSCHLYRKPNGAGGYTYYSNEVGHELMIVWDTCLTNESTLLTALACEHHRKYLEYHKNRGWKPPEDMKPEQMAHIDGQFISPNIQAALEKKGEKNI